MLESDRKIRALSLLKYSNLSLSDIEEAVQADCSTTSDNEAELVASSIAKGLNLDIEPTVSDANVIFYASGAIARSIVKQLTMTQSQQGPSAKKRKIAKLTSASH